MSLYNTVCVAMCWLQGRRDGCSTVDKFPLNACACISWEYALFRCHSCWSWFALQQCSVCNTNSWNIVKTNCKHQWYRRAMTELDLVFRDMQPFHGQHESYGCLTDESCGDLRHALTTTTITTTTLTTTPPRPITVPLAQARRVITSSHHRTEAACSSSTTLRSRHF